MKTFGWLAFVIGCGALGGWVQGFVRRPDQSSGEQIGTWKRIAIGGVTAVIVVGILSQSAFSDAIEVLHQWEEGAGRFEALVLVAAVALGAGLAGQTFLRRVVEAIAERIQKAMRNGCG